MSAALASPLLDAATSPLDARQRAVVDQVSAAERAHILALPSDDPLDPKRRARVELTGPELFGQPDAVEATLKHNAAALREVRALLESARLVYLVGAGDSLAVMDAARVALQTSLGVPCIPIQSLELAYFGRGLLGPDVAVLALSSSGETTRTVEALLVAQNAGARTVALTNTAGSTLEREATLSLLVHATRRGWPTQSSTAALALLLALAGAVVDTDLMREVLESSDQIAAIAEREVEARMVLFSGGGPSAAAAVVGAAKVKECTPVHALAIQVEEYHHYNSQKVGEPLLLIAPTGPTVPRAVDTGTDAHRWGGRLYVVTTRGETAFDRLADDLVLLPPVDEAVSPLLTFLPAQLLGYHLGLAGFRAAERAVGHE